MFYPIFKIPRIVQFFFPSLVFQLPNKNNEVFLTFDDGPTPLVTDFVLDCLAQKKVQASFFCLGKNVEKYPNLYKKIIEAGHTIGNHTYSHLNAFKAKYNQYIEDVDKAQKLLQTPFFRPPYGKITWLLIRRLKKKYNIILFDLLANEFLSKVSAEKSLNILKKNIKSGSIIVLHDSDKCCQKLQLILPKIIDHCQNNGFVLKGLK